MSQFAEPKCLARLEWKNFGKNLENLEGQCELSRKDSGPSSGPALLQLLWSWCAWVAERQAQDMLISLEVFSFPFYGDSQLSEASSAQTQ